MALYKKLLIITCYLLIAAASGCVKGRRIGSGTCGNGVCEPGETHGSCPEDCSDGCGDGVCSGDENAQNCPLDCVDGCGDGVCAPSETPETCPADCGNGECGDNMCDSDETFGSCPEDCQSCDGLSESGCCDGDTLYRCEDDTLRAVQCGAEGCGWTDAEGGRYACGHQGEDPSGVHPRTCGCEAAKRRGVPKIYNGTPDPVLCLTEGQILAVGALAAEDSGGGYENFCTATLVTDTTVLTAAHCVMDYWGGTIDPDSVFFVVGVDVDSPVHVFAVQAVAKHPGYGWEADHDVGVLTLTQSALSVLPQIRPIPVNRNPLAQTFVNQVVQNVGYGATHDDPNNTLRWWTTEPVVEVRFGEFVVYGNGWSSVCYGDSGGPSLYAFDDRAVKVIGTVSWGDPSCVDYDHFCRVDANLGFLDPFLSGWDECQGLTLSGACDGDIAQWCEGGQLMQQCCSQGCALNGSGMHRCVGSDPCDGITELGTCRGDELVWCDNGQLRRRFCNVCGNMMCGWVDDQVGYNCIEP